MRTPLLLACLTGSLAAQASWTQIVPATTPGPRTELQMDSDGTGALLFAGQYGPSSVAYNDLWRFDGVTWTNLQPAGTLPPARSRFAAGYDPIRGKLVIFGGDKQYTGATGAYGDTWEWDAATNTWAQMTPVNTPTARIHSRMAFSLINVGMLLYGGRGVGNAETWLWDGVDWTLQTPATQPPGREQTHLATDWSNGTVLMYGGSSGATTGVLGDTWIWTGGDWVQVVTATTPGTGGIRNGKITYDSLRGRVVGMGGVASTGTFLNTTWEFDGIDWTERTITPGPTGRTGHGLAYVNGLGTTVLYGGYAPATGAIGNTWTYQTNAVATATSYGSGCAGSVGVPTLDASGRPWIGDTLNLNIGNASPLGIKFMLIGFSNTAWAGGALPAPMGAFGFPACTLLASPDASNFVFGSAALSLPNDAALIGFSLYAQAAVLEPQGASFGLGMSAALALSIGAR